MDGGDPWSMLKCTGGVQDKTIINRIMLRFRPIAPKPVTVDSVSGESMFSNKNLVVTSKREKRKYVRVRKKNGNRKGRRILDCAKEDNNDEKKGFVTLQLMPEKADLERSMVVERSWGVVDDLHQTLGNNYHFHEDPPSLCLKLNGLSDSDHTALITSSNRGMTVESVTETCMDGGEMENCTDVEKIKNLEKDTCPGFVSDVLNRVLWVNQAYKNMVLVGLNDWERAETAVGLMVKDGLMFPYGAFSCRVGLQYGDGKGKKYSKMVTCDVWRMSSGGLAWRLDLKAALSLGL
ncbi:hypothetical protein REPUB_Repub10bG0014900 [Reevesia pubescens]